MGIPVAFRVFVSLTLTVLFFVTLVTGLILFVEKLSLDSGRGFGYGVGLRVVRSVHTYVAIAMGVLGLVHLGLNAKCLASYLRRVFRG